MPVKDGAPAAALRRGRPRSTEARDKILAATEELLSEGGFQAVTMESVAARAGVAKTTLYRWWPNRAAVALDCVSARMTPIADTSKAGTYRQRFQRQLKATIRLLNSAQGHAILALVGAKQTDPALAQAYSEQIAQPRRAQTRMLAQQAIAAGEIAEGTDPDLFLDTIYGPLYYRKVVSGEPVTEAFIDCIVDAAFTAFGPSAKRSRNLG
ncbi:transcriptional regulator, TetR family [Roseomonas rosea]|uniref:Transcriptional regulator, TetR family n=1 Tax=Muricoccus roseus TaxID=198092 RepID=A0A1M6I0K0_9PROT|nr:TetR/AcrR family transcriptional regulator [Roseomonas rosea]SHJ27993.1 transcriptional regulator, TetR family [Roseomonas rosea]